MEVSPDLSLGVAGIIYSGNSQRDRTFLYADTSHSATAPFTAPQNSDNLTSSTNMDISAVSATLGAMLRAGSGVRLGLALHLPEAFTLDGHTSETETLVNNDSVLINDQSPYEYDFKDKITLPMRLAAGISCSPSGALDGLLLSGDLTYADWKQIDYLGPIRTSDRGYAYRATTDLRLGAEYAFPRWPVRVRVGYILQPLAYRLIGTDVFYGGYQGAEFVHDQHYFTFGGGILVDQSLTIDVAYITGGYTRSGGTGSGVPGAQTIEQLKDNRLVVGAAFRI